MKIALVYFRLTTQAGGQQQVYSLAQELTRQGHVVVLYTAEINREYYPSLLQGIDVRVVPPEKPFAPLFPRSGDGVFVRVAQKRKLDALYTSTARRIAEAMENDFDAVNCHEDFAYKTGYFYKRINPRARVVWTMNNPPYMRFPKESIALNILNRAYTRYKDATERKYFLAVDAVAVLSRYEEAWAKDRGLPVRIVWSGIDFKRFYAPAKAEPGNPAVLMGLGALNAQRRYEDIIDAVALLKARGHAVRAKIIAKDIWNEAGYRALLLSRVAARGVEPEVQFNFEGVSEQGLREAYRTSDVFLLTAHIPPPQGYGWGSVAFEAAAAGLPVVLNRETGAAHVLSDGENALFATPGNPQEYASQVERILKDHALYRRIAEEGQRFVRENISWTRYAKEMVQLFSKSKVPSTK
ncbi:MAG: glycosyltransferase family 4 protein [Candidatus Liptonbacteria bacterium]|nr:glycosyltransferase family 4 protein [Candidatus Liptonbacteria bacterium]